MMIKHVNALKLKSEFKSHKLIKEKRAFDAQKQEKNKDLIFICHELRAEWNQNEILITRF